MQDTDSSHIQADKNLQAYNTLGIASHAKYFAEITGIEQLQETLSDPAFATERKLVLGSGSNVLFVRDFNGLVLHVAIPGITRVGENEQHVWVRSGAGVIWHDLVRYCVRRGWGGIENLSLIPGTVGAAPIQNIGAYGVELEEVFHELQAVDIDTGKKRLFTREECRFGYRDSIFKRELNGKYVITDVTLRLDKDSVINDSYGAIRERLREKGVTNPTIRDISDTVIEIRQRKLPDPKDLGNAGSFFKNPVVSDETFARLQSEYPDIPGYPQEDSGIKVPAGWLIEAAGWKGKVIGNVGTYRNQALVIVNHGNATGREIMNLARRIRESVSDQFGIELVPEVNIIA